MRQKPFLLFLLTLGVLTACQPRPPQGAKIVVVATFFPVADIVQQVGRPHVQVENLLPPESDLHSFSPTARQMKQLHDAKAVFALGFGAEPFLEAIMQGMGEGKPPLFELGKGCKTLPLAPQEHHHHHHGEHDHAHHAEGVDPHLWLSLDNAMQMVRNAQEALSQLAPQHRDAFSRNAQQLLQEIQTLKANLQQRARTWRQRKFLAAHGAYRYLGAEAGIEQVGAFEPLPGVEPTARSLRDLMSAAQREGVKVIFVSPPRAPRLVEAIAADMGMKVYILDPLERSVEPYQTYQQRMQRNIDILDQAMR